MSTVLDTIVTSAAEVGAAAHGWLVVPRGEQLEVVAATDPALVGSVVRSDGATAAYVLASGQPVAMVPRADDPGAAAGVASLLGVRPTAVLCVPCAAGDDVVGALELVDKAGGGAFTFDDVEIATLLATVAGAALREAVGRPDVRSPAELGAELRSLAQADPEAYVGVATVLEALLARG